MRTSLWRTFKRLTCISQLCQVSSVAALALITLGLSAQVSPATSDLPANQQVIAFLTESIDWYHYCAIQRQMATEPVDLVFMEDSQPSAGEILQLSFDFARAYAKFSSTQANNRPETVSGTPELARFVGLQDKTKMEFRQANEEMEVVKSKLKNARGADRRKLEAVLDATQSRLDVLNAGLATIDQSVNFMRAFTSREAGDLSSTIDDLARTIPDVSSSKPAPSTQNLASLLSTKLGDSWRPRAQLRSVSPGKKAQHSR